MGELQQLMNKNDPPFRPPFSVTWTTKNILSSHYFSKKIQKQYSSGIWKVNEILGIGNM